MAEKNTNDTNGNDGGGDGYSFVAPKNQAEFDRMVSERLRRERAKFADYDDLRAKAEKLEELEKANQTDLEKANGKVTAAEKRAEAAEKRAEAAEQRAMRLEVALAKAPEGMSLSQIRKLAPRLQGSTQAEMEADAEDLFADFTGKAKGGNEDGEGDNDKGGTPPLSRKPAERLRAGNGTEPEPELDTDAVLAKIPRL